MKGYKQFDKIDDARIQGPIPCEICQSNIIRGNMKYFKSAYVCESCYEGLKHKDFLKVVE
jgi:formylmethanofuran dehydrogenase subunit E